MTFFGWKCASFSSGVSVVMPCVGARGGAWLEKLVMNSPNPVHSLPAAPLASDGMSGRGAGARIGAPRVVPFWLLLLVARVATSLWAHDPGISTAQGELRADVLVLTTGFSPIDVQHLLPPEARSGEAWTQGEFDAVRVQLQVLAPKLWEVRVGESLVAPREVRVQLVTGDNVTFELVYPRGAGGEKLTLRAPRLTDLPAGHRQFVIIADQRGSTVAKKLISARDFTIDVSLPTIASAPVTEAEEKKSPEFWGFIRLGVEHIWTGYDHLLFLFSLLVVCRSFRSIVTIVSCFTLAHSITLALATLEVVNIPSRFVEPAIAASIVYVGLENLWRRGAEPRGRWALTFAFGLVHGFGFASVLRDLGIGSSNEGIAIPLLSFNLGVEMGQIVVASAVLPLVWQLRKHEKFVTRGVPALSAVVTVAGLYWLLQRTVLA